MLIIPTSSDLYSTLDKLAQTRRMIFITGLPGVGKSLLIQQLSLIAHQAGRTIHLMQWDISRQAFETEENLAKYPEIDGVTDPMLRKAIGLWSRKAVAEWAAQNSGPEHLLIGELPLIGNRLSELIQPEDDLAEPLLQDPSAEFVVPVPSLAVRAVIENSRGKTIANPQNEKEKMDAPPHVLQALWAEVHRLAQLLKLIDAQAHSAYDPSVYGAVYGALLQHRHHSLLSIEQQLEPQGSVYDSEIRTTTLSASPDEASQIMAELEATMTRSEVGMAVEHWHNL